MKNYMNYLLLDFLSLILIILIVLIGVAFLTLLERKFLGLIQMRKGPNKVGMMGIFQPFSDAIKLFSNEIFIILKSHYFLYYLGTMMLFFFMLCNYMLIPVYTNMYYLNYSLLNMMMLLASMGYLLMLLSWASNSMYSKIGSLRVVAQTISYEVSFIMIMLILMMLCESYSFIDFIKWQVFIWNFWVLFPLFLVFFISVLAELNRSPMDFIEGESELVSGFNVEYFSGGFALIFMAEYGMIIFFSYLMVYFFFGGVNIWEMSGVLNMFILVILFMRGILPRMRYDELMYMCWKVILPFILGYMIFILGVKFFVILLN